jgi:hypothetical protein
MNFSLLAPGPGSLTRDRYERMHEQSLHREFVMRALANGPADERLRDLALLHMWLAQPRR